MTNLNPLALLDELLADWTSPRVRRLIHGLILLAAALVAIWLAADGDWIEAVIALAAAVYAQSNKSNTPATDLTPAGEDDDYEDDLSYEEAGGMPYEEYDEAEADLVADDPLFEDEAYQGRHRADT